MREVKVGIIGLGNVGGGTLSILTQNRDQIERKLGFPLTVAAVASRTARSKTLPAGLEGVIVTEDWREVVSNPDVDVVAELVGGTGVAREIVETAIANGKAVVTANKELMGLDGVTLGRMAAEKGVPLAMEASVCGGIPIHAVLKEGICGDRIRGFFGILNGTTNYILTEIEQHGVRRCS